MSVLTFDEAAHVYRIDGTRVPSVTGVIAAAGLVDTQWYTPEARERGRYVHQAIELSVHSVLNKDCLDARLTPYLNGFELFVLQSGFKTAYCELRLASERLRYAGTLDLYGGMNGVSWLIDVKSGVPAPAHDVQLAAYASLAREAGITVNKLGALYLSADGKYNLREVKQSASAWEVFQAALVVERWKIQNGA